MDKIFIKMSKEAIEIQRLHKPAVCDRYVCACSSCMEHVITPYYIADYDIDKINNRDLSNVEPTYATMVRMADVATFVAFYNDRSLPECLSYIWLPTQEQLQGMIPLKLEEFGALHATKKMIDIINRESTGYYFKFQSMEQLWLAFVMKERFNKTWKGETWIK